jgi:hypothetical protein
VETHLAPLPNRGSNGSHFGVPKGDGGGQDAGGRGTRGIWRGEGRRGLGGGVGSRGCFSLVCLLPFLCSGGLKGGEGATVDAFGAVDGILDGDV